MSAHIGDNAELYPLGVLDDDEAREVERHIAGCDACAARVADAQRTAASLAATLPPVVPSPGLRRRLETAAAPPVARAPWDVRVLGLAAALAVALAGLAWESATLQRRTAQSDVAFATIVHSHFKHVTMTPAAPPPFGAKILYAPDGSWLYVIADRPPGALHAIDRTGGEDADLGELSSQGAAAVLLAQPGRRVQTVELRRGAEVIATAKLAY